ncbi:MAG: DUF6702 family protein [Cyclobacteriaceae bacterium]
MIKAGFILLMFCQSMIHPFHISITDIEHDEEARSVEIAQKIFTDDLETALNAISKEKIDLNDQTNKASNELLIKAYLERHLQFEINGKQKTFEFVGVQREEDATWCFVEIPNIKKLKSIRVSNRVLMKDFDDQMNLIHIKKDGKIKSMRLTNSNYEDQIVYE